MGLLVLLAQPKQHNNKKYKVKFFIVYLCEDKQTALNMPTCTV